MITLEEYRNELLEELRADASIGSTDTGDEFISRTFELLDDSGELPEPTQIYFGKRGKNNRMMQIDGYAFDNADSSLCLVISDFQDTVTPETLIQTQITALTTRLGNFLDEAINGNLANYCDDSDEILPVAVMLKKRFLDKEDALMKIKYFIITNKSLSNRVNKIKEASFNGIAVETYVWSIERFYQIKIAGSVETIKIDLQHDFGSRGIPCIKGDLGSGLDYDAYIAIVPGKLLADLYIEYGSRLLEGNVRAFLGAKNTKGINAGIRRTILNDPTKFFTFNNGIAVTAASIETVQREDGLYITALEDMQIINGGQTTASLATSVIKKENPELEGIYVPMKLTVITDRETTNDDGIRLYDQMVSDISRYANSQNKVTAADFFSNNPFHIKMEQLSKRHLAPPAGGCLFPTGWYYERSRGKYNQEMVGMTKSEQEKFQAKFPKKQIITKEKLAKYLNAVNLMPYYVSKGANKNIVEFANWLAAQMKKSNSVVNELFFKKCVCAAIIFEGVDNMVKKASWYQAGGYKLNIVPYTVSKLFDMIPADKDLNWQGLWQSQTLSAAFIEQANMVARAVNTFICNSHGMIVTEYCKKKETWEAFRQVKIQLLPAFYMSLVSRDESKEEERIALKEEREIEKISAEITVVNLGSAYWQSLLRNPIAAGELNYKDRSFLEFAAAIETSGKVPTSSQAKAILAVRKKLIDKGIIAE